MRLLLHRLCLYFPCAFLLTGHESFAASVADTAHFEKSVLPLLKQRCFDCHSHAGKIKGGLVLDSRSGWQMGGEHGSAIVPGKPDVSLLIKAIRYTDPDLQMPPKQKLTNDEQAIFETWVKSGAYDPREGAAATAKKGIDIAAGKKHWAFQPIKHVIPKTGSSVASPIDTLIVAKASPPADKATLMRRAYFDLIGLPPTYEEVQAFVQDASPNALAKVIDHLLASPLYGQRWGRHWLDVARYADTREESTDSERRFPFAYTYRDYVINAFNDDKPFNEFIVEQIAADRIPKTSRENLAALGFLNVGRRFQGNADALNLVVDDRIDAIARGFLGLTISCARCHDHKFDAIPTRDYYSLFGILASMEEPLDRPELRRHGKAVVIEKHLAERDKLLREEAAHVDNVLAAANQRMRDFTVEYLQYVALSSPNHRVTAGYVPLDTPRGMLVPAGPARWEKLLNESAKSHEPFFALWHKLIALKRDGFADAAKPIIENTDRGHAWVLQAFREHAPSTMLDVAETYGHLITRSWKDESEEGHAIRELVYGKASPVPISRDEIAEDLLRFLTERKLTQRDEIARAGELRAKFDAFETKSPIERAMVVTALAKPVNPHVLIRGDSHAPGDAVPRRFLQVLSDVDAREYADDGRLQLAQAIASPKNPLTARVIVNRVWQHHFGVGLVSTPDDFGTRAEPPAYPELLDHLADWFMQHDWSIKSLHRYIMLSKAWQSSIKLPARGNESVIAFSMRLEFEPMRDALLFVAGNLDARFGGASEPMDGNSRRRAVYNFTDRFRIPALLRNFDVANPDTSISHRSETLVPQQALYMMNHPFVMQQADAVMKRQEVTRESDPAQRIRALYRIILARDPADEELAWAREYVSADASRWSTFAQVLMLSNEFVFVN